MYNCYFKVLGLQNGNVSFALTKYCLAFMYALFFTQDIAGISLIRLEIINAAFIASIRFFGPLIFILFLGYEVIRSQCPVHLNNCLFHDFRRHLRGQHGHINTLVVRQ